MPYNEKHLIEISLFKTLSEAVRAELDDLSDTSESLTTQLQTLEARYDVNVTASTDSDADYAAEVVDARVDTLGNSHASLGANIREGQRNLSLAIETLEETQNTLQYEYDTLSASRVDDVVGMVSNNERRKEEISIEASERRDGEFMIQLQLQELSEAVLRLSVMVWNIREELRNLTQEE